MTTSWASLDPWEKAARWHKAAPELAADIIEMAKTHAAHRMDLECIAEKHRMELEGAAERHRIAQEQLMQAEQAKMNSRLWYTHLAGIIVNAASLILLTVIAAKLGKDAIVPALTVLGAGGGLTAGSMLMSSAIRRQWLQTNMQIPTPSAEKTPIGRVAVEGEGLPALETK